MSALKNILSKKTDGQLRPPLFTEVTIYVFGTLFTVIFGGCLIAYK